MSPFFMQEVLSFLQVQTPTSWLRQAANHLDLLLIDHAHCEKKAASTALQLMFRYVDRPELLEKMAQLAREELLHFEQVLELMKARGIQYRHLTASCYAQRLRQHIRSEEPLRLIDTLVVGAIIEARSCERFYRLAAYFEAQNLHPELVKYYRFLLKSESRHFLDYLDLARCYAPAGVDVDQVVARFLGHEQAAVFAPDQEFRFHSGAVATTEQKFAEQI